MKGVWRQTIGPLGTERGDGEMLEGKVDDGAEEKNHNLKGEKGVVVAK